MLGAGGYLLSHTESNCDMKSLPRKKSCSPPIRQGHSEAAAPVFSLKHVSTRTVGCSDRREAQQKRQDVDPGTGAGVGTSMWCRAGLRDDSVTAAIICSLGRQGNVFVSPVLQRFLRSTGRKKLGLSADGSGGGRQAEKNNRETGRNGKGWGKLPKVAKILECHRTCAKTSETLLQELWRREELGCFTLNRALVVRNFGICQDRTVRDISALLRIDELRKRGIVMNL